jgi:hypothetical protein
MGYIYCSDAELLPCRATEAETRDEGFPLHLGVSSHHLKRCDEDGRTTDTVMIACMRTRMYRNETR